MGNFFPDYGSYGTGNPLLDHLSGFANEEEEEERDPFDIDFAGTREIMAQLAPPAALPAAPAAAAPAAAAPAPERLLQKRELINKARREKKEAEDKAKGAAAAEQGLTTGGLTTYGRGGVVSGQQQGGFGKQTKLNPARR